MTPTELEELISTGETLRLEFKSDARKVFNDSSITEVVVCLANGLGGNLLIGVEDDGTISGARHRHGALTDPIRLQAMVANNTVPQVVPDVEVVSIADRDVVRVGVEPSRVVVGTRNGLYVRRGMGSDGQPACLPYLAHEMLSDRIARGEEDLAAIPEPDATMDDLDPEEFDRFRRLVSRAGGGSAGLAGLGDTEILSALEVAELRQEHLLLKRGALLLFGTSNTLRRFVPTHETVFQVLEHGAVQLNVLRVNPLFKSAEALFGGLRRQNVEDEVMVGLVRVGIDRIPEVIARELVANALVHRDYTIMGSVLVQLNDDQLTVTSPGGFPRGVTLENFLETSNPRSRILADAFKHAGLVDRAGRGINKVFEVALRSGRPQPEYDRTTSSSVVVTMDLGGTDLELVRFVIEHDEGSGRPFDLADLQIVRALKDDPRLTVGEAADILQRSQSWTKTRLARLLEEGLIEMRGDGRARRYTLSAATYRKLSSAAGYVRVRAFDEPQQVQMILNFIETNGSIARSEAAELCGTSPENARRILLRLRDQGVLRIEGERRTSRYVRS